MVNSTREGNANVIFEFIRTRFPSLGAGLSLSTPLLEDDGMDSLGVLELVSFLSEAFDIEVSDEDFLPQNFETVESVVNFVDRKHAEI